MQAEPERHMQLDRVWKRYRLGGRTGLLDALRRGGGQQDLWAVRDVSLRLGPGESVGLIGHNGAGKTTILKLLAGISRPTRGRVQRHGRVASLINLGAGFHPELTGRENVYLNGVILGLTRQQVRERFDAIVEFAELESAIDTPLKRYSSGMQARLGFSVAAHVDADVLLVDEVLSVGDLAFQDRSIRAMLGFRDSGRSILFVSHNLSAIEMMCQRVIWLDHGQIRRQGPTAEVVRAYLDALDASLVANGSAGVDVETEADLSVVIAEAGLHDGDGGLCTDFDYGEPLVVRLRCVARADLDDVACSITIRGDYGPLFSATTPSIACWSQGQHQLACRFERLPLLPGLYRVEAQVRHAQSPPWALPRGVAAFRVGTDLAAFGSDSLVGATKSRGGFLAVPYTWRVDSVDGVRQLPGLRLPEPAAALPRDGRGGS